MLPPNPNPGSTGLFLAEQPVNMKDLSELALVAGAPSSDYSAESSSSFTVTIGDVSIVFDGTFTYTAGLPDPGGTITGLDVTTGTTEDYSFSGVNVTVAKFDAANAHTIGATLLGGTQHFFIQGSSFGGNTLYGFGINQQIYGSGFDNTIFGSSGNDTIVAGAGNDRVYAGRGNDLIFAGNGPDYIDGGPGNNTVWFSGQFSSVYVTLNNGLPVIAHIGATTQDTLVHIENLIGGLGPDKFVGDSHNNLLVGGTSNDTITGGSGNDTIDGGYGRNILTGGSGHDVFLFDTLPHIQGVPGHITFDEITDFVPHRDKIWFELHFYDSFTNLGPISAANFRAGPHVTHGLTGQQFIAYDTSTGNLYYDLSGAGGPVYQIAHLDHHPVLHASNFAVVSEFSI